MDRTKVAYMAGLAAAWMEAIADLDLDTDVTTWPLSARVSFAHDWCVHFIVGDAEAATAATAFIGVNLWLRGQTDEVLDAVREACRFADHEGRSWAETTAFIIAGIVEQALDPTQPAHHYFERAVDAGGQCGPTSNMGAR